MDWGKFGQAVLIAYVAVGILEWIKAGVELFGKPKEERKPVSIIAWAALPAVAAVAAALFDGGWVVMLERWGEAWATAQLGYPLIVKLPAQAIEALKAKAS